MSDPVKSPSHYNQGKYKCPKCDTGIECITIAQEMPYNLGAAVKYIWRHKDKGNPIQDLEKAKQYIQFEIDRLKLQEDKEQPPMPSWYKHGIMCPPSEYNPT